MGRREDGGSPINGLIGAFIGLLVIVAVIILAPVLAGSLQAATPALPADSEWNSTYNADLPTGEEVWTQNVAIGSIVILVFFVSMAILYIRVIA